MNNRNLNNDKRGQENNRQQGNQMRPDMQQGQSGRQVNNHTSEQQKSANVNRSEKQSDVTDEELMRNVKGHVGARKTGSSKDDIAGVADIDSDLKR